MKQKFFEINNNRIVLFPNEIWKVAGTAAAIMLPICWLAFLVWAGLFQWFNILYMAVGNTVAVLPFFYTGSRQIIMDEKAQVVFRKSWLGLKKAYSFSQVEDVVMVNMAVYNRTNAYFKLTLKNNPYGKGIQLNMAMDKTTPQFASLQHTAIPFIKNMLATNKNDIALTQKSRIETEAAGFKMFRQKEGVFVSKPYKKINLIAAILFFCLSLYVVYELIKGNQFKTQYYWLLAIVAVIVNLGIWGERTQLNPGSKTITKSYSGLFIKTYTYKTIIGFTTLRHVDGIGNPTDVCIEIDNGKGRQQLTLFSRIGSAKKLQLLMEETKRILIA